MRRRPILSPRLRDLIDRVEHSVAGDVFGATALVVLLFLSLFIGG